MLRRALWKIVFTLVILSISMLTLNLRPTYSNVFVGDVNGDGKVNMKDLVIAAQTFGSNPDNPRWNPMADVNGDNKVDMKDLCTIVKHFGDILIIAIIPATVDVCSHALNLRCIGRWITAHIELPEGYSPYGINVSTVMLNDTIPAKPNPICIGDYDCDSILDLMVKFDRQEVIDLILHNCQFSGKFGKVTLTITGKVNNDIFEGSDNIKIIKCVLLRR